MRWVGAFGVFACALVAGFVAVGGEGTNSSAKLSTPSGKFLTRALGEKRPGAPLVRHPAPGVRVRLDRSGFRVSGREATISLSSPGSKSWERFAGGVARPTPFGRQTIVVTRAKAEEFLTVDRRQGTRTWRWKLAAGGLQPRLGDDGAIGFVDGHRLAGLYIEPVAILDAGGEDVTPDELRWSLERRSGVWSLALRLDDSNLPLPYVIDPAIAFRSATTAVNAATAFITIVKPAGVVQYDLLLAHLDFESGSALAITPPAGWGLVRRTNNGTDIGQAVYRLVAGAAEPVSYTFNFDIAKKASAGMSAYTGVSTTTPINVSGGAIGNSATPTAPSITTTVTNTMLVALFGNKKTSTYTPPAGMTERYDVANIAGGMPSSEAADQAQASTGATGTRQATSSDPESWVAQLVALRMADTIPPAAPVQAIAETSADSHANGETFYYRPAGAGGTFTVTSTTSDAETGMQKVNFPGLAGGFTPLTGYDDTTSPYSRTYTWPATTGTETGSKTVTAYDNTNNTATGTFTITPDSAAPPLPVTTFPAAGSYNAAGWNAGCGTNGFCGTSAADATSGLQQVDLSILRDSTGLYWDGVSFAGAAESFRPATGTSSWSLTFPASNFPGDGTYTIRVRATDNVGNAATIATLTFTYDSTDPTGSLTAPAAGANVRQTITVSSNSADTSGSGVANAKFQRSPAGAGTWTDIATDADGAPWQVSFDTTGVGDGLYDLRVITTDAAGNAFTSPVVANVRVDNGNPSGSITAPSVGANVRQTVTVSSDSADGGSGVATARFERSPAGAGTWTEIGTDSDGAPWQASFDTTAVGDGLYDLRVITTDAVGNAFTSPVVANVRVDNTNPSALFGFPAASTAYGAGAWDAGCAGGGFCGTHSDGGSGVQQVEVSIQRVSNGLYWNAGSFSSGTEVYETASLAGSDWSLAFDSSDFPADGDYIVHARARDAANNVEAGPSRTFTYDNSAPTVPSLSYGSFQDAVLAGGVIWYRPSAGSGQFEVTASSSDPHSGVASYSFPAAASGWSVSGSGAARTYSHSGSPTDPSEPNNVTATNGANLTSSPASFTVSPDSTAPAGQTISLAGGPFYATQSVAFTTGDGSDGESGLDTASRLVERAEADLTNGSCGSFGAYGGSYTSPDTSVATGKCYRYRFSIADRLGNRSTWVESAEAKVDTSAPATPGLTVTETPADPDQEVVGQILYYRPGANGGTFTVSATASDAQSGIKHVSFPPVATVVGGGADDSLAPYEQAYVWSLLTDADTAAGVTTTNNASSTSGAANFEVRPDSTAPTSAIQCNSGACSAGWYSSTVSVSLSAGDAAAGVSEIRYTTDGSVPSPINGTVYSAPFDVASTATVRFRAYDKVGNEELVGQQLIRIDTIPPTTTPAAANTSGSVHWNGSGTVFYRPGGSGGFDLTATVTDGESGPQKANFPVIAGFGAGADDTTVPYSSSYSYSGTPVEPGAKDVTGYDNVNRTSTATVNITADSAGPTGHSATIAGGYYTALSVAVTLDNGTDAGAGVDPASAIVERDEAPLDNGDGSCDAFPGSWAPVTLAGGADTGVESGKCYRYRYQLSDRVGNGSTSGASATAKVDTSAPAAPTLGYGSFQAAALAGGVVWYRPSAGSGQFAVTASTSDAQSGIAAYAFPAPATGWSRSLAGATATYSHSGSPSDPAEPNDVTAQNNAGLTSGAASFTVSADSTGPTGQAATVTGGYFTSLSVPVTLTNGSDGESGLDAASGAVERESVALSDGNCGSFSGSWSSVTLSGGADTTVQSGNCYRYRYTIADRVGNVSAPSAPSAAAKIDTGQPSVTQNDPGANLRATVALTASASDSLSGIATVAIQRSPADADSWTTIGTDNSAPFSVDFDTTAVTDGLYDLRAIATDGAGNVATSSVVADRRVDNTPPSATMNNPGNPLQGVITLSAGASDAGSGTNTATFEYKPSSGSTWSTAGSDSTSPFSITWDTMSVSDGRYDFRVVVTDLAGNSTTSASINNRQITNNPPIASITAPGDYVNASDPNPFTITATASAEWPKTVDHVEFFRCTNTSAGCATGAWVSLGIDVSAPYSASWTLDPDGLRSLKAVVEDNTNSTNSDILDVTIDRTPPAGQTISLNGGPWFTAASVGFTTGDGSDGGSGLNAASRLVERAEATLTNGACNTFAGFAGSFVSPDSSVASGNCYRYRFSIADNAGNRSAWVESGDAKVDTSAPSTPALTVAESPADPDQHVSGSTLFYRPGGGRAGSFSVSATTSDDQSGIQRVTFPAIAGMTGGGDDLGSPYQTAYDWTETTGASGSQSVSSQNGAGTSSTASFTLTPDTSSPSTQSISLNGGPWFTGGSVGFTTGDGSDSSSGLDTTTRLVERAEAPLTDGSCGFYGPFSGSYSSPDTTVVSGKCYRYRFSIADNVGNRSGWAETNDAKVDDSAPGAPGLVFSSLTNASATGSTLYYLPSAGSGEFTVTASATDGESGVASYSFPAAAAGWTVSGTGATRTYSHSGSPADPVEPNNVTAQNNAGLTSPASSFDVTPDSAGPTGQSISAPAHASTPSVAFTTGDGSDTGSGVDTSTRLVRRAEATLSNDTCDSFGSPSGSHTSPDNTVTSGHCYRYELTIADKVGNVSAPVTVTVKVDTTAPGAPSLSYGSFSNAVLSGGVVFYRPSAATGQFAVTASSSDPETGVSSYSFPSAPAGWSRSVAGAIATYSHSGSPSDPAEPNDVTATNNAGLTSGAASFTVSPDAAAPATSIQCGGAACAGWATDPVSVTLSSADGGSGVFEIRYTTDGSDPTATTGTVYGGAFVVSVTTEVRYRAFDRVGNAEVVHSQAIEFDASGPTAPTLTLAEAPADPDQHVSGTTLYYRPGGGRSGTFTVEAATGDPQSGIERVTFAAIAGMTGDGDDFASPYQATYDWTSGVSASGPHTVTARNNAGMQSNSSFTVAPDSAPPSGQSVVLAGGPYYTALSVALTLDNGTDAASGVEASSGVVERQSATLSGGNCTSWSGSWTPVSLVSGADTSVLTNKCYRYRFLITDNVGNQSGPSAPSADAMVDATTPVTSDDAPAPWRPTAVTVGLSVSETGSGVASTQYRVDGGSFQNGTSVSVPAPADHSNDGVHTIEYRSTDAAGNVEALRSATVRIDTTLPTTIDDAPTVWRNSAATVTLAPNDALSGVASTEYRVDGGGFQSGTSLSVPAPADHSNDGVHTIEYRSTDVAGNVEPLQATTVRIDTTLPSGSIDTPSNLAHVNGMVDVSALAGDAASGIASVEFRVRPSGSGSFSTLSTDSTAPFEASWDSTGAPEGNVELQIVVSDNASNVLTPAIVTVVVDNPPAVSLDDPGANVAGMVNLAATSSADTNQVVFERSPQGAGTWTAIATDLTTPFAASFDSRAVGDNTYDFRAVATDLAGFTASSSVRAIRVDNTAPSVSLSDPANDAVVGGPNVHLGALASDLGSGVGSVRFEARAAGTGAYAEVATDLAAPYDATWNASALAGSYELRALATDAAGNAAASASVLVSVDSTAPSVTLADVGAAVRGVVTLSAATQGAAVTKVVFKQKPSGGDSWTDIETDTAGPWNAVFDTKNVSDGLYDLRAQAADSAGTILATHAREGVRVDNTDPSVQTSIPADGSRVAAATSIVLVASEPVTAVRAAILDGAAATPEIAGSRITFATGSLRQGKHELTGSLEDAVGNSAPFRVRFTVRAAASATLVLRLSRPRSSIRGGQQIFVVPISLSRPAKVEATLLSPTGRRVRTTRMRLPAGRNPVRIAVPRASLPPGRYTILVTATGADGTQVLRRVRIMVKGVKHQKRQTSSPAPKAVVVPVPDAPPPPPVGRTVEPGTDRPAPGPTTRERIEQEKEKAEKTLEAASRFVKPKEGHGIGLVLVLLAIGGAIAFLIKIELRRLLAWPRRFSG